MSISHDETEVRVPSSVFVRYPILGRVRSLEMPIFKILSEAM